MRICMIQYLSLSITSSIHCSLSISNHSIHLIIVMSEQIKQDENGTGAATEQNPMVQRISLEVKRREPSSESSY